MATRRERVILDLDANPYLRGLGRAAAGTSVFVKQLDTGTDRATMLTQSLLAVGPALVPIGAAAVPAIAGLAAQLSAAGAAAGVSALAFSGIGDTLDAVNKYQLEPTQANFEAMQQALEEVGPAGAEFVRFLDEISPKLQTLQDRAREGVLPGAQEGIEELMELLPQARSLIGEFADTTGDLFAEAGDNLNDPRWREFFEFIEAEARPTLTAMGRTLGNVVEGLANLMMAADPLSDMFTEGLLSASRDFNEWTSNLDETQGFQSFLDYVTRVGPKAWETLGAVANAGLQLVEAAAPVGEIVLPVIEALADGLAAVAESPAGPILIGTAAGLSAISRAVALYKVANGSALIGFLGKAGADGKKAGLGLRHAAAGVGVLALSLTDVDDKIGLSNAAMGAAIGLIGGPWGAAIGGAIGATLDAAAANDDLVASIEGTNDAIASQDFDVMRDHLSELSSELARFKDQVEGDSGFLELGRQLAAAKNRIEGLFGSSDVEEAEEAVRRLERAIRDTKRGATGVGDLLTSGLASALGTTADQFETAADSADEFRESLTGVNALLDKRSALRAFRDALRDFRDTMKEAPKDLRRGTAAFDLVQEKLDAIADAALTAAGHLKDMDRVRYLDRARVDFVKAAVQMGLTRGAAKRLADSLGLVDRIDPKVKVTEKGAKPTKDKIDDVSTAADRLDGKRPTPRADLNDDATPKLNRVDRLGAALGDTTYSPDVIVDAANALGTIANVRGALRNLDGTVSETFIRTTRETVILERLERGRAYGGPIDTYASGGRIAGSSPHKRADNIDVRATAGEFMQQVDAVNFYGLSAMYALNERRIPREALAGYADGGPVVPEPRRMAEGGFVERPRPVPMHRAPSSQSVVTVAIDYDRLAAAVASRSGTFELYDTDGALIGRMRGEAADVVSRTVDAAGRAF